MIVWDFEDGNSQNSYLLASTLIANLMKKRKFKSIINLNSIYGLKAQNLDV